MSTLRAQVNDAGLWFTMDFKKDLGKGISGELSQEFRLNENLHELGTVFSEVGITYEIKKDLSAGASYRFAQKRRLDDSYSTRHRYMLDVNYRKKIIPAASITIRERFQSQYADIHSSDDGKVPENYLRSKLGLKVRVYRKTDIYLSTEWFFQLNNPEGSSFNNVRNIAGAEYDFSKRFSLDVYYLINKEFNKADPWTDYVTGLALGVKL